MRTISVKVQESLDSELAALARKKFTTKSAIIREALVLAVQNDAKVKASRLDRIRDLIGCVRGPGDLSHNKTHLKGFGQ
ncbi:MAG: ribbon-helix-helix protein, CopG family [Planctomycetes bacterium]|nr:ribbon-helix-helix protein, CopG family [Planctomycetota bacterium]